MKGMILALALLAVLVALVRMRPKPTVRVFEWIEEDDGPLFI